MYHALGSVDKSLHGLPYQMRSALALLPQRSFYDDLGLTMTPGARLRVVIQRWHEFRLLQPHCRDVC